MNIVIFGFKSCGKTTYGTALAAAFGWPFIDTDQEIEKAYSHEGHAPIKTFQIHEVMGKEKFREFEMKTVLSIKPSKNTIISVGGGTVLLPEVQSHLKKIGHLIYLKENKEVLKKRLSEGRIPAYLDKDNFEESFEEMYQKRLPIYQKLAQSTIDCNNLSGVDILEKLIERAVEINN